MPIPVSARRTSRRGFTLVEMLVAMALIVFIMSFLNAGLKAGLDSFRQLKASGDFEERLRTAVVPLRHDMAEAHFRTERFMEISLRAGAFDPEAAAELREDYATIEADATDLEARLRAVERETVNPAARRLLRRMIATLADIKESAATMVELLSLILD